MYVKRKVGAPKGGRVYWLALTLPHIIPARKYKLEYG